MAMQQKSMHFTGHATKTREIAPPVDRRVKLIEAATNAGTEYPAHRKATRGKRTSATLQDRIVTLVAQDLTDVEIAERLGCRREYVRVARRRAGLLRAQAPQAVSFARAEAELEQRIGKLKEKLAEARQQLQAIRKRAATN